MNICVCVVVCVWVWATLEIIISKLIFTSVYAVNAQKRASESHTTVMKINTRRNTNTNASTETHIHAHAIRAVTAKVWKNNCVGRQYPNQEQQQKQQKTKNK